MPSLIFDSALYFAMTGQIDFDDDSFAVMLVSSSYSPSKAGHRVRSDVTGEITGSGYVEGGKAVAVSASQEADRVDLQMGGALWGPATLTAAGAVYYKVRGGAASSDELVAFVDFQGDVKATNGNFTLDVSQLRILNGEAAAEETMVITLNGPDGGQVLLEQVRRGPGSKEVVVALASYRNAGAVAQTIAFPSAFAFAPVIWPNSEPPCTASDSTLTLPANMAAPVDAIVVIKGF
jgi:hypothetical protein